MLILSVFQHFYVFAIFLLRKVYRIVRMRSALADRILIFLNVFRRVYFSSYFPLLLTIIILGAIPPSYLTVLFFALSFILATNPQRKLDDFTFEEHQGYRRHNVSFNDWVEDLKDEGPAVAAYVRVSTGRQAKEGFSLIDQVEKLRDQAKKLGVSRIFWFIDAGKSARKHEFNREKLEKILSLAKKGKIEMLLSVNVDRIGRECIGLLVYLFELSRLGVITQTPEKRYDLKDLGDLILLIIEAYRSEKENKRRAQAARDGKAQAFKSKRWNKPIPKGYRKTESGWLEKVDGWDTLISEIYDGFLVSECYENVIEKINRKYSHLLSEPLLRHQIRRILTDPVYIGEPEHLGVKVVDPSLAYVERGKFLSVQKIIQKKRRIHAPKIDKLRELVENYGVEILDFLKYVYVHCPLCDSKMVKNGTRISGKDILHIYICTNPNCRRQLVVPSKRELEQIRLHRFW